MTAAVCSAPLQTLGPRGEQRLLPCRTPACGRAAMRSCALQRSSWRKPSGVVRRNRAPHQKLLRHALPLSIKLLTTGSMSDASCRSWSFKSRWGRDRRDWRGAGRTAVHVQWRCTLEQVGLGISDKSLLLSTHGHVGQLES